MKVVIDTVSRQLSLEESEGAQQLDLYSNEAFYILSELWMKVGWNQKHIYTFSWMGRPIIQLPEDMIRTQEVLFNLKPDVVIETGVAHGGSLVYYASLMEMMGKGRVIGVDIEIRPQNRIAIEAHPMSKRITLVEGSSTAPDVVGKVQSMVKPGEVVLVILDSDHSYNHVTAELEAYHNLVTPGSYIVATDGCQRFLTDVPRGKPTWDWDNPAKAAEDFAARHAEFVIGDPAWNFNESTLDNRNVTHWPSAWLRRA